MGGGQWGGIPLPWCGPGGIPSLLLETSVVSGAGSPQVGSQEGGSRAEMPWGRGGGEVLASGREQRGAAGAL